MGSDFGPCTLASRSRPAREARLRDRKLASKFKIRSSNRPEIGGGFARAYLGPISNLCSIDSGPSRTEFSSCVDYRPHPGMSKSLCFIPLGRPWHLHGPKCVGFPACSARFGQCCSVPPPLPGCRLAAIEYLSFKPGGSQVQCRATSMEQCVLDLPIKFYSFN